MLLLLSAIFVAFAVSVFALSLAVDSRRDRARVLRQRLEAVRQAEHRGGGQDLALLRDELLSEIPTLHRLLSRSPATIRLQRLLSQGNVQMRAGKFLLSSSSLALGFTFLAASASRSWLLAVTAGFLVGAAPFAYVSWRRTRRFQAFERQFPDAVDLLGRAVRAGHAFSTALELIGDEMSDPIAGEFRILFEEQKFGLALRDALLNFAERVPLVDVKFFVTAVLMQRETGGNLAEILDKLSYLVRERFKILRQVKVFTAQGRMTFLILMILPPACLFAMMIINREFVMPLFTDPMGNAILSAAVFLQVMGWYLMRKVIRIEV